MEYTSLVVAQRAVVPFGIFIAAALHTRAKMKEAGSDDTQLMHMMLAAVAFYGLGVWAGKNIYYR